MSLQFLEASLLGDSKRASECLGATLPIGWPDVPDLLRMRKAQLERDPGAQPWLLRAICDRSSRTMVGHIGFHTRPAPDYLDEYMPGGIELGFSVFEGSRRQGYAREAAIGLMNWARDTHGIVKFVLSISPGNAASQNLARSLGFRRVGSHPDDVDGEEDVLALDLEQSNAALEPAPDELRAQVK